MKVSNKVATVSNYATDNLDKVLDTYGENGYVLVSTELALNKYNQQVMYLFFTKEEYDEVDVYAEQQSFAY